MLATRFLLEDTGKFIVLIHLACSNASSPFADDSQAGGEHYLSFDSFGTDESTLFRIA
jgi:hypothetical protein